jgi:predicted PurR-regulated permease PerM
MSNISLDSSSVTPALASDTTPKRPISTLAVYGLLTLAILYTLYFAKTLLIPIIVALLFSLLLSPLVTLFRRFYIPRTVSAILLLTMIGGPITILAIELAEPAQKWLVQLPKLSSQLTAELDNISQAMNPDTPPPKVKPKKVEHKQTTFNVFGWFSKKDSEPAAVIAEEKDTSPSNSALSARVMQGGIEKIISILGETPVIIAQFMTFVILVLFLLSFGSHLYESYLEIFPSEVNKRRPVVLVAKLQKELSRYIITVTIINMGLGIVTASVFWMLGVDDALLWGAVVGLLNFAPYVGPFLGIIILCLAGVTQYGMELFALLPATVYFGINMIEAQFVTPTVLGLHMQLNPLVLILWLLIWGWLWGPAGVLLAVPLLVCMKLAARQLDIMTDWVKLVETSP